MAVFQVFDPPMCCSTGVCGPTVNPVLTRFAADLEWLKSRGAVVQRFNLAHEPGAFAGNPTVQQMLEEAGPKCLPLILVDGQVWSQGIYPSRDQLAACAGIATQPPIVMARGTGCCGGGGCCG